MSFEEEHVINSLHDELRPGKILVQKMFDELDKKFYGNVVISNEEGERLEEVREFDEKLDALLSTSGVPEEYEDEYGSKKAADLATVGVLLKNDFSEEKIVKIVRFYRFPKEYSKEELRVLRGHIRRLINQSKRWWEEKGKTAQRKI